MNTEKQFTAGKKREFIGVVIKRSGDKSAILSLEKRVRHPKYKKSIKKHKKLMFHDEKNLCGIGDTVKIVESRPFSKRKKFRLLQIITKAKVIGKTLEGEDDTDTNSS